MDLSRLLRNKWGCIFLNQYLVVSALSIVFSFYRIKSSPILEASFLSKNRQKETVDLKLRIYVLSSGKFLYSQRIMTCIERHGVTTNFTERTLLTLLTRIKVTSSTEVPSPSLLEAFLTWEKKVKYREPDQQLPRQIPIESSPPDQMIAGIKLDLKP